jgi:hypothetical protein
MIFDGGPTASSALGRGVWYDRFWIPLMSIRDIHLQRIAELTSGERLGLYFHGSLGLSLVQSLMFGILSCQSQFDGCLSSKCHTRTVFVQHFLQNRDLRHDFLTLELGPIKKISFSGYWVSSKAGYDSPRMTDTVESIILQPTTIVDGITFLWLDWTSVSRTSP